MPANFSRIKDWVAEVLTYEDLNAEIDNILNNLDPDGVGDYSNNLAQMQDTTDPFPSNVPSLAVSLAGEIERLRFQIQAILGTDTTYWYEDPPVTLSELNDTLLEGGLPASRLDSGPTSGDGMIRALRPDTGANGNAVLDLTLGPLVYYVQGIRYQQNDDVTITGFSGAPTTNNTCLVNDAALADQQRTRYLGQYDTFIPVDTVGSEITAVAERLVGFKINNGAQTEYFIGVYSTLPTPGIYKARRQNFFDYQMVPDESIVFSNNDTITLCRLVWIFIGTNGVLSASYGTPTWSDVEPVSPDIGDYWFDLGDNNWRIYSPSGWTLSNSLLIGQVILDGTTVVGARTVDKYQNYVAVNEIDLEVNPASTAELRMKNYGGRISVYGVPYRYGFRNPTWTGANLEGGAGALANNTTYYAYIEDDGTPWLSTTPPTERLGDLLGYYHPSNAWRCLGYATTGGSGVFHLNSVIAFSRNSENSFFNNGTITGSSFVSSTYSVSPSDSIILADSTSGAFTITLGTAIGNVGRKITIKKTDSSTNLVTVDGNGSETIDGKAYITLSGQYESVELISDNTNWLINGFNLTSLKTLTSSTKTPAATAQWQSLTGNSFTLSEGRWEILTAAYLTSSGGSGGYTRAGLGTFSANGADTITIPTAISSVSNLIVLSSMPLITAFVAGTGDLLSLHSPPLFVNISGGVSGSIFGVTYIELSTPANARVVIHMTARKIGF